APSHFSWSTRSTQGQGRTDLPGGPHRSVTHTVPERSRQRVHGRVVEHGNSHSMTVQGLVGLADQGRADTASTFLLPHHPVTDVRDGAWIDQGPGPPGTLGRGHPQQAHGPASTFGQPDPRTRAVEGTSGDLTGLFGGVGLQEHPTEVLLVAVLLHQ